MVSYFKDEKSRDLVFDVLILVVVEDGLVLGATISVAIERYES